MFALHDQLQKDCTVIGNLPLSTLLLMNDANYPWFVLVPRREQVREWYELSEVDQRQLLQEANALAKFVQQKTDAKKNEYRRAGQYGAAVTCACDCALRGGCGLAGTGVG